MYKNIRRYIIALLLQFGCIISMSAAAVPDVGSVVRQDGAVVESTDYYPYGTPFTTAGAVQPYKYGTKELDRMHGFFGEVIVLHEYCHCGDVLDGVQ